MRRSLWGIVGALLLLACGPDDGSTSPEPTPAPRTGSDVSSAFTVDGVPADLLPVVAGTGTASGSWGDDEIGTDEPFTALSPDGTFDHPEVVVVAETGFAGYQGRLFQASAGYVVGEPEEFTVDGRRALHAPATTTTDGRRLWSDLIVRHGDDLAVRVSSPAASRDRLVELSRLVEPSGDEHTAPLVAVPDGLQLVGSVNVDAVVGTFPGVSPDTDRVPGPSSAHSAGWQRDDGEGSLVVSTLPGTSADLRALPLRHRRRAEPLDRWTETTVDGRPAMEYHRTPDPVFGNEQGRALIVESAWGDLVVVHTYGSAMLDRDTLVDIAASVEPTDDATWDAFVVDQTGGPGLHPDRGRTVLATGTVGNVEWLLQNGPPGGGRIAETGTDPRSLVGVDPCLKLSDRTRACPWAGGGSTDDWVFSTPDPDEDSGLSFAVVSTTEPGAAVRITTDSGTAEGRLIPVPGGELWAAVVFVDRLGEPVCDPADPIADHVDPMRVEVLDESGRATACLRGGWVEPVDGP